MRIRSRRDGIPYDTWVADGLIEATEGNVIDYDVIRERIIELSERYNIRELPVDRWNSTQIQTQLRGEGVNVIEYGQGFASMNAPTKEIGRLVATGKLRHGGNPVLRWMASNVAVEQDAAGNQKLSKARSSEKIDGLVALAMAIGRAMSPSHTATAKAPNLWTWDD